jgi:hypothetical protein
MDNLLKEFYNKVRGELKDELSELTGEDVEKTPHGEKWLRHSINRIQRYTNRNRRIRKPEPHFRTELVARQKKFRSPYPRN